KRGQKAYVFANIFFQAYDTKQPVPDVSAEVRKQALEVKATAAFTRTESVIDSTKGKALADLAYTLNPQMPVSDYQQVDDGFIVLHLLSITPSQQKSFDTVHSQVETDYLNFLTVSRVQEQAKSVAQALKASLAQGKTWKDATAQLGLKPQTLPPLVPAKTDDQKSSPLAQAASGWAAKTKPGSISDPVRSPSGAAILYLAARENISEAERALLQLTLRPQLEQMRQEQVLNDWISGQFKNGKTNIPPEVLGLNRNNS
ncbi:MAG: peptidyl-prolyl cis-trans isomerase, partial [Methylacidiphilales bacterium]|nr:peptidyl-prolyl cis-trans isomerase [Candidatus Methylacidiphilales bacterium]